MPQQSSLTPNTEILLYAAEDGATRVDVRLEGETVWLTQQQLAELFQSSRTNIVEHIQHVYDEGELDETATCRNFRQVRQEGSAGRPPNSALQPRHDHFGG